MEIVSIMLPESQKSLTIVIERKKMKTCRLKAYPSGEVKISVPLQTSSQWIEQYLNNKSQWIEKRLDAYRSTVGYASTNIIKNGMSITMLGQDLIFSVKPSQKDFINKENKILHIGCPDINNQDRLLRLFERWWREQAINVYQQYLDSLYPIIERYGKPKPRISVKRMKTLWGSCSVNREIVTLNFYLLKARPACIEYVVLHELVHFLYPNHSRNFYDFLGTQMPDWKERKNVLDHDVVHGL